MFVRYLICVVIVLGGADYLQAMEHDGPESPSTYRAVLDRYCVTCHNEKLKTAGLMLDMMNLSEVSRDTHIWEKVIRKLRTGQMPPSGMPRPDKETYETFANYLENEIDRAAETNPNPGRTPTIRRLSRTEYVNAIRDLLALEVNGDSLLPPDDSSYGFDNIGEVLSISPILTESYLSAAELISRLAIGDANIPDAIETYEVPDSLVQTDRMSDELPFGTRGGLAFRHYFPLDAEYVIEVRLRRGSLGDLVGFEVPTNLDVRLDKSRVGRFTIDREDKNFQQGYRVRLPVNAGNLTVGITFPRDHVMSEGMSRAGGVPGGVDSVLISGPYKARGVGETPSRRKIFICHPSRGDEERSCARKIISKLIRYAYRRPVSNADVQPLLGLFEVGREQGGGFDKGIQFAVEGILVSPGFLLRAERDPTGIAPAKAYHISDLELASRLSFFLWSSIPDDELLSLAEKGSLRDPGILEKQVERMLSDTRSDALVESFGTQWLQLSKVPSKAIDMDTFPDFDENLRLSLQREGELFFASIIRENRSIVDLLDANYTFLDERLARHYGIPNVYGSFQRVTLDENSSVRRGLLGKGSLMMVTSYTTRTSPVLRGKWILENILGTPPPPPPPNIPSLVDDQKAKVLTMRERMEQHRNNPVCVSCHKLMDPLGFALDNFDATGKWRDKHSDTPIDASGTLPDGTKFDGPSELREILVLQKEQFIDAFLEKFLTYALGRGADHNDSPAIRKIIADSAPEYRWSSLTIGLVKSTPFQMRRIQEP